MTTLLLIRHATNDWIKGRLPGWTPGIHLNAEGKQQAHDLGTRLAGIPLQAVYSSPLERTLETAEAIATPHSLPVRVVDDIGEVRYGDWTGANLKELYTHELWQGVQFYPSGTRFPKGETLGEVQQRAVQALDALCSRHAPHDIIAAVSHADVIKLVVAYYIGMHIDLFQRLVIYPASVTTISFQQMGPRLMTYNDTGTLDHLKPAADSDHHHQQQQQSSLPCRDEQA